MLLEHQTILLADPNPSTKGSLEILLRQRGHRVTLAGSADEALHILKTNTNSFDIIIVHMDFDVGKKDGLDVIRESFNTQIKGRFLFTLRTANARLEKMAINAGAALAVVRENLQDALCGQGLLEYGAR